VQNLFGRSQHECRPKPTACIDWLRQHSVADLYRCRCKIEVFFKQIKQTLQLADFLGNNCNAARWQVWIALLVYVLLRFQA
jgi:hypothetical protein